MAGHLHVVDRGFSPPGSCFNQPKLLKKDDKQIIELSISPDTDLTPTVGFGKIRFLHCGGDCHKTLPFKLGVSVPVSF
jgi:hypothetical protein